MANIISAAVEEAWKVAKPFQVEDAEFAALHQSTVMGHKTGLGKTFMAQLAWSRWPGANKALIVGTLGSCATWYRLLQKWGGITPTFMQGRGDPRFQQFLAAKEGVFMTTYMSYHWLMKTVLKGKPHVDVLINDEIHRVLRHRNELWKSMKRLDFDHYLGLSATWASRGPQDLWAVLSLVNRRVFPSYWDFAKTWCYVDQVEGMGTQIYGVRNEENLRKMLWSRYYRARTWSEVGTQFRSVAGEPVLRRGERVAMGKQQLKLIQELETDMIVALGPDRIVTSNSLALLTRKLQMAISPKILLPQAEYGGPVDWLVDKINDDPHSVVFCPFREGLEVVKQACIDDKYPENRIFMFRGGMQPEQVNAEIARWKKARGLALVTTAFAQSFELDTTDNAYSLGFSWDPNDNEQAEGRLRRLDSILQSPCNITYIVPQYSDYENVVDVLDGKIRSTQSYMTGYERIKVKDLPLA